MKAVFNQTLMALAEEDTSLQVLSGDLGFGLFEPFRDRFPRQFLNAGVAEQNMMGLAAGLAREGHRVVVYSIGNFGWLRCLEQIRNDVVAPALNVTVVAGGGGFGYGVQGLSHHLIEDIAMMRPLGVSLGAPACDWEAAQVTSAMIDREGPGYLRLERSSYPPTAAKGERLEWGRMRRLRDGQDLTLVGCGGVVAELLRAADSLAKEGVRARVLSVPFVSPLDTEELDRAARETGGVLTAEEHVIPGGMGAAVAEYFLESDQVPLRFGRLGVVRGACGENGSQEYLRRLHGLGAEQIATSAKKLLGKQASGQRFERGRPPLTLDW